MPFAPAKAPAWASVPTAQKGRKGAAPGAAAPKQPAQLGTGRTLWIVLAAVLTELVLIGGLANQWISNKIGNLIGTTNLWDEVKESWLTYTWRLTPRSNQTHLWASELALVLITLALTGLLVFVLVRGPVTFWRAFFGSWLAVLAATLVAAFVRGLIAPLPGATAGRFSRALYGPFGPSQFAVVGAAMLGLIAAAVAGIVTVTTRSSAGDGAAPGQEQYRAPEQPPPYYGEHPSGAPAAPQWGEQHFQPRGQPTGAYQPSPPPPPGQQQTQRFLRPPDDQHLRG